MRILISNDDGIEAKGISVLEEIAKKFSDDVYVFAPKNNMSGAGHSLTLTSPLRMREYDNHHFSVNGTPTDSVVMALRYLLKEKPDFVFSGINFDANMADDVTYSGTVAAAIEACLFDIPSIAFSQRLDKEGNANWEIARTYAPVVLKMIMEHYKFKNGVFLNVNFPSCKLEEVKGIKITSQGTRAIDDHVIKSIDPRGVPYFWIGSADYRKNDSNKDITTDLGAIHSHYVSITPMTIDMTAREEISQLKEIFS